MNSPDEKLWHSFCTQQNSRKAIKNPLENKMIEKRQTLNKNINYDFIIRSSFFYPFDEMNLKISFFIDNVEDSFVGYYHLAINDFEEKNSDSDKSILNSQQQKRTNNRISFKKVALA